MRPSAKSLLKTARIPAVLISDLINIRYLTGCRLSSGLLLVSTEGYTLFVDARYSEQAPKQAFSDVALRSPGDLQAVLATIRRCGVEADHLTLSRLRQWKQKFKSIKFVHTYSLIEGFRRKKDAKEISTLLRAKRLTKRVIRDVPTLLKSGMTEKQLAWQLEIRAQAYGGDGMSFDSIVAFAEHTSRPHHHPTGRKFRKGDLVQIDCGVRVDGYCGDLSEVFFTGPATEEQKRVYRALKRAQKVARDLVRPGISSRSLDQAARAVLAKEGIDKAFTHALGHGVGLEVHEGVTLSSMSPSVPLVSGEVITLEPGVYFPGKFGMRVEDMIVVE